MTQDSQRISSVAQIVFVLLVASSLMAGTATRVLQPGPGDWQSQLAGGKDIWTTSVYSWAPGGGGPGGGLDDDQLQVGGWGDEYHSLLQFDLAGMPSRARSASLELYRNDRRGAPVGMFLDRIVEPWSWTDRLWWADRPAAVQWRQDPLPPAPLNAWYSIDVTDLYNAWMDGTYPNYGLQLRPTSNWPEVFNVFWSSDYLQDPSRRPRLVVVYEVPTTEPRIVVGLGQGSGGALAALRPEGDTWPVDRWLQVPWSSYRASGAGTEPATGDLDGDGLDEIVVGLSPNDGGGWIALFDDADHGYAFLQWLRVPWRTYNARNGGTHVAAGDLDGDGRAEVVFGLGSVPGSGGVWGVFAGLADGWAFAGWHRLPWSRQNEDDGEVRPTVGDVDGDGRAEVVLCPSRGASFCVLDDATTGFGPMGWGSVAWSEYRQSQAGVRASIGDLDGDGKAEIALGLDRPGRGWMEIRADASASFEHAAWVAIPHGEHASTRGETRPALGDTDRDGRAEIVCGFGRDPRRGGWLARFDDATSGYAFRGWTRVPWEGYALFNGETLPAVGHLARPPVE